MTGSKNNVLAQALRDRKAGGIVRTVDINPAAVAQARENALRAGVADLISFSVGDSLDFLRGLARELDHIDFVFDQSAHIVTWRNEFRNLPESDRHRLRYLQRLYTEEWVRTVRKLRPELDDARVKAMCDAAIALIQSPTEYHSPLAREDLAPLLARMATQALLFTDLDAEVVAPGGAQTNGARRTGPAAKAGKVVPSGNAAQTTIKKPRAKRARIAPA